MQRCVHHSSTPFAVAVSVLFVCISSGSGATKEMVNPLKSLSKKLSRRNLHVEEKKTKGGTGKEGIDDPQDFDILLGRGKTSFNHVGNRRFRVFINLNLRKYMDAGSRMEKTLVVNSVVEAIHEAGGRFLKQDPKTGRWHQVNTKMAREKVGHALRDAVGMRLKMGNKSSGGSNNNNNSNGNHLQGVQNANLSSNIPTSILSLRERRSSDVAQERAKRHSVVERPSLLLPQATYRFSSRSCNDVGENAPAGSMAADARRAMLELGDFDNDDLNPIPLIMPTEAQPPPPPPPDDATDSTPKQRNARMPRVARVIPNPQQARQVFEDAALSFQPRGSEQHAALGSTEFSVMSEGTAGKWFGGSGEFSLASVDSKVFDHHDDLEQLKEEVSKTLLEEFPETAKSDFATENTKPPARKAKPRKSDSVDISEEFSTMSIDLRNSGKQGDLFHIKSEEFGLKSEEFHPVSRSAGGGRVIENLDNLGELDLMRMSSTSADFSVRSKDFHSLRVGGNEVSRSSKTGDLFRSSSNEFAVQMAAAAKMSLTGSVRSERNNSERFSFMSGINLSNSITEEGGEADPGLQDAKLAAV